MNRPILEPGDTVFARQFFVRRGNAADAYLPACTLGGVDEALFAPVEQTELAWRKIGRKDGIERFQDRSNIEIRKLTPDLAEDYARFFDVTTHNQRNRNVKCYCVFWCGDDCKGKKFSSKAARRDYAVQCVIDSKIQGYLAYRGNVIVGWCNANTKNDCLKCKGMKGSSLAEEAPPDIRIKSVFCFAIAPDMRRQGVASRLLERVCRDAAEEGFDIVETYLDKKVTAESEDFVGYAAMYEKSGFTVYHETEEKLVMRKPLK